MTVSSVDQAFVLGAGLGTRLRHLTARRPKPLIPICQKALITFAFDHLMRNGIRKLVINTHHRAEAYKEVFPDGTYRGVPLHFRHEPDILETAGGIRNAEDLLDGKPFVVYNGDILTDLPLGEAVAFHEEMGNEVTMVLRSKDGPLHVSYDPESCRVVDIAQRVGSGVPGSYLFTGLYVVNPDFFRRVPPGQKISVIPIFVDMIREGARLGGIVLDSGHWWDLGTRSQYLEVHRFFSKPDFHFSAPARADGPWPVWIHPSAEIHPTAHITGATAIGAGARIGAHVTLRSCVVWEGAEVRDDSILDRCIVTAAEPVSGIHTEADL